MSTLDSKLEYRPPSVQSPARRKLETLLSAHGYCVISTAGGVPNRVRIDTINPAQQWTWKLVSGSGNAKDSIWELEYERGGERGD